MMRFRHALRQRLDLDFADDPQLLPPGLSDHQAIRTINWGIYSLYLDIRQEGIPTELLEAHQRIRDLLDSLYAPSIADFSWLPF